jgi:acetyl esterase
VAPEHPFRAGLEDCYAALRWPTDHAATLGGHDGPVAVGGESAGGNLAAAVALMARDRGGPEIALQVLLVPMTARHFDGGSRHDPAVSLTAPPAALEWLWRHYLGEREEVDALVSPLDAETLAGLPPAVIVTAEYDVLRDEAEAYAARLEREGVPVELRRYDGMHHDFAGCTGVIEAADECMAYMAGAVRGAVLRTSRSTQRGNW